MRHIEIIARREVIRSYSLSLGGYKTYLGGLFVDIIRILAGKDRRAIGVHRIIAGGDEETSKSLTIHVKANSHFFANCRYLRQGWITRTELEKRKVEKRIRVMRHFVEKVARRRHLELVENCQLKDEEEASRYRSTDIDSVFTIQTLVRESEMGS